MSNDQTFGKILEEALKNASPPTMDEVREAVHSLEASLTEAVRDNPTWARSVDHVALEKGRAILNKLR